MDRCKSGVAAVVLRVVVVPIAVVVMAGWPLTGSALADPPATQVINAAPVGPNGEPIDGYQEAPSQGNVTAVGDCTTPSPSAVVNDIYYCSPRAADAGTCWLLPWPALQAVIALGGSFACSQEPLLQAALKASRPCSGYLAAAWPAVTPDVLDGPAQSRTQIPLLKNPQPFTPGFHTTPTPGAHGGGGGGGGAHGGGGPQPAGAPQSSQSWQAFQSQLLPQPGFHQSPGHQ
jgi:hypothetical protein